MTRQVNGFVGTYPTITELTNKYPASDYAGCSANVGVDAPYVKAWSDGNVWAIVNATSLPVVYFKQAGVSTSPVSSFAGVLASGTFGVAQSIKIPANTIVNGSSILKIRANFNKTGTDVGFTDVRFGASNSSSDTNLFSGQSMQWNAAASAELVVDALVYFAGNKAHCTFRKAQPALAGISEQLATEVSSLDFTIDNYINFVMSGTAAGTTYNLLGYEVSLFR